MGGAGCEGGREAGRQTPGEVREPDPEEGQSYHSEGKRGACWWHLGYQSKGSESAPERQPLKESVLRSFHGLLGRHAGNRLKVTKGKSRETNSELLQ